jgi:hypothetical protein
MKPCNITSRLLIIARSAGFTIVLRWQIVDSLNNNQLVLVEEVNSCAPEGCELCIYYHYSILENLTFSVIIKAFGWKYSKRV